MEVRRHSFKGITKGVGALPLNSVECGFSKTERMYDLVLGLFINRYEFGVSV